MKECLLFLAGVNAGDYAHSSALASGMLAVFSAGAAFVSTFAAVEL